MPSHGPRSGGARRKWFRHPAKLPQSSVDQAMTAELKFSRRAPPKRDPLFSTVVGSVECKGAQWSATVAEVACSISCANSSPIAAPSHAYQLDAFAAAVLRGQAVGATPRTRSDL